MHRTAARCRRLRGALAAVVLPACCGCAWLGDRGYDLADCVRTSVGGGLGLAVDAHLSDFLSPGVGVASYVRCYGWFDREIHGGWTESYVINTPRLAYEALADEYAQSSAEQLDREAVIARLALSSLNLPNERWIRRGGVVRVEHFALFNFADAGERQRAWWLADLLVEPRDVVMTPVKSMWQRGWVEVGVTAAVLHGRAGFNPLEFVDLLAGLIGFDPAGDDGREPFYELEPLERPDQREPRFWER